MKTISIPAYRQLATDEEIKRYLELVAAAKERAERHARVISGTGSSSEQKETAKLLAYLRGPV